MLMSFSDFHTSLDIQSRRHACSRGLDGGIAKCLTLQCLFAMDLLSGSI